MEGLIFGILQYVKIVLLFLLITFEVDESLAVILSIQMFVQEVIAFIQLLTERLLARILKQRKRPAGNPGRWSRSLKRAFQYRA